MVKRGRPRKNSTKNSEIRVRLGTDDRRKLKDISAETGMTRSEIVRRAISLYYHYYEEPV